MYYIAHSAKGSTWEDHMYVKKVDGNYYYPDSYAGGRHISSLRKKKKNASGSAATGPATELGKSRAAYGPGMTVKSSEYTEGDTDFDEKNYSDENLLGDTDFYGFQKEDGSYVILEEDNKWVVPPGKDVSEVKDALEKFSKYAEERYQSGKPLKSKEWMQYANRTIEGAIKDKKENEIAEHSGIREESKTMSDYLVHHGIKGQKWGVRRFQYEDGTLTPLGRKRLGIGDSLREGASKIMGRFSKGASGVVGNVKQARAKKVSAAEAAAKKRNDAYEKYLKNPKDKAAKKAYHQAEQEYSDSLNSPLLALDRNKLIAKAQREKGELAKARAEELDKEVKSGKGGFGTKVDRFKTGFMAREYEAQAYDAETEGMQKIHKAVSNSKILQSNLGEEGAKDLANTGYRMLEELGIKF